jgi:hypothetical protein
VLDLFILFRLCRGQKILLLRLHFGFGPVLNRTDLYDIICLIIMIYMRVEREKERGRMGWEGDILIRNSSSSSNK